MANRISGLREEGAGARSAGGAHGRAGSEWCSACLRTAKDHASAGTVPAGMYGGRQTMPGMVAAASSKHRETPQAECGGPQKGSNLTGTRW